VASGDDSDEASSPSAAPGARSGGGGAAGEWHSRVEGPQELEKAERGERRSCTPAGNPSAARNSWQQTASFEQAGPGQSVFSPFRGAKGELS
jgi:hypothetical protein